MGLTFDVIRALVTVFATVVFYDHASQFTNEIRYIWRRKLTAVSFCYLMTRYATDAVFALQMAMVYSWITVSQCSRAHRLIPILYILAIAPAQLLLLLRCWCLWGRRYCMLPLLIPYWVGVISIQCVAIPYFRPFSAVGSVVYSIPSDIPPGDFSYCTSAGQGVFLSLFWIMPMTLDFVLLVLVVTKVILQRRASGRMAPLAALMLKQQVGYFTVVFVPFLISSVLMTVTNPMLQSISDPPATAMVCVAATRIVHGLKREMEQMYSSGAMHTPNSKSSSKGKFGSDRREAVSGITSTVISGDEKGSDGFSAFGGQTASNMSTARESPTQSCHLDPIDVPDHDLDMLNPLKPARDGFRGARVYQAGMDDAAGCSPERQMQRQEEGRHDQSELLQLSSVPTIKSKSIFGESPNLPPLQAQHDRSQRQVVDAQAQRTFEAMRVRSSSHGAQPWEVNAGLGLRVDDQAPSYAASNAQGDAEIEVNPDDGQSSPQSYGHGSIATTCVSTPPRKGTRPQLMSANTFGYDTAPLPAVPRVHALRSDVISERGESLEVVDPEQEHAHMGTPHSMSQEELASQPDVPSAASSAGAPRVLVRQSSTQTFGQSQQSLARPNTANSTVARPSTSSGDSHSRQARPAPSSAIVDRSSEDNQYFPQPGRSVGDQSRAF